MRTLVLTSMGLLTACAWAGPPTVDLAGAWRVRLGEAEPVAIALPGTLGDADLGPAAQEPRVNILTPRHQYIGPATYSRTFTVPAGAEGAYELFLERVLWKSTVSLDGKPLGSCDSLAAPHVYAIPAGTLTPGEHTIAVTIDNTLIQPIGEDGHNYGDSMQTRWNGAIGTLEIRPANPLRKARVFAPLGDVATVKLPEGVKPAEVAASVEGIAIERLPDEADALRFRIPGARPWELDNPQLYTLTLTHKGLAHTIRFGFRTFATKGNRLLMNGRPLFLRGNLDCCHFPLTGYPAMDKGSWLAIYRTLKAEGVNEARYHSWAPPKAAFDAADEIGMLIAPETIWVEGWMRAKHPYVKPIGRGSAEVDAWVHAELFRILDAYGNAPSFFSMSVGNELGGSDFDLMAKWLEECRAYDNRHLYSASTARNISKADDFMVTHHYPGVGGVRGRLGEGTDWDYEDVYARTAIPTVAHEIGQWPVFPLYAHELPKYEGLLRPWNLEVMRERAARAGTLRFNETFSRASLMTNRLMYKAEIESFLRTPSCNGLQLLSVQDYMGQGEALVGWYDAFYDPKPGLGRAQPTADYFAPVTHLARFAKHVWTDAETLAVAFVVRNNGRTPIDADIPWAIPALGHAGVCRAQVPVGAVKEVGRIALPLAGAKAPAQIELRFGRNRWPLWVYPATVSDAVPAGVVVTDSPAEARKALAKGARVLLKARDLTHPKTTLSPRFTPVYWSGAWFSGQTNATLGMAVRADSPAFAAFPTDDWQDWQWRHLVEGSTAFRIAKPAPDFEPLAMPVPDFHHPSLSATLFETAVGPGKLLVCGFDLDADRPEARQLRRSLLDYAASDAFAPKATIAEADLWPLFRSIRDEAKPRPAEYKAAPAYFECAAFLTRQNTAMPWKAKNDRAELAKGAYAIAGDGLCTWSDNDGSYWVGNNLTITLTGLDPVVGTLLVRFRDPNNNGRTAEGALEGRPFKVGAHNKTQANPTGEHWARLNVQREDFLDGKLVLAIRNLSGPNFMIDRLILLPNNP